MFRVPRRDLERGRMLGRGERTLGHCWLLGHGWRWRERVNGVPPFQIGHLLLLLLEEGEVAFRLLFHFLLCERESGGSLGNP